jgi:hypothetical protein
MIGLAASKSRRTMREPVTVISSTPAAGGSCAVADVNKKFEPNTPEIVLANVHKRGVET